MMPSTGVTKLRGRSGTFSTAAQSDSSFHHRHAFAQGKHPSQLERGSQLTQFLVSLCGQGHFFHLRYAYFHVLCKTRGAYSSSHRNMDVSRGRTAHETAQDPAHRHSHARPAALG